MTRRTAILVPLLAALAACGRKGARTSDFDSAAAAALAANGGTAVTNMPKIAHVTGFEFSHRLDQRNIGVGGPVAEFAPSDSILLSVRTQYAAGDVEIGARLRQGNKTLDSTSTKTGPADSAGVAFAAIRFGALKKATGGAYQAEVFLGGKFQMARDFSITR